MASAVEMGASEKHADLVHDVAYDFYGRRVATVSSDQYVKIFDLMPGTGKDEGKSIWKQTSTFKAHAGSVWRVAWAHPEFGQILATASFDNNVHIWREQNGTFEGGDGSKSSWAPFIAQLTDSRTSVVDVKFAPKHLGLKLVSCAEDGMIRFYEAMDVMNLSTWTLTEDFKAKSKSKEVKFTSVSWNPSKDHAPMVAVGSNETVSAPFNVQIWELQESRRWTLRTVSDPAFQMFNSQVHDVAFAPNMGRSYHMLAAATNKGVKLWKISVRDSADGGGVAEPGKYDFEEKLKGGDDSDVWRVSWNVTGTTLASAGKEDNIVRLWLANFDGQWEMQNAQELR